GLGAPADKVYKLRDFDPEGPGDVPDPYYGSEAGFHDTYRIIERSLPGLLDALLARLGVRSVFPRGRSGRGTRPLGQGPAAPAPPFRVDILWKSPEYTFWRAGTACG